MYRLNFTEKYFHIVNLDIIENKLKNGLEAKVTSSPFRSIFHCLFDFTFDIGLNFF